MTRKSKSTNLAMVSFRKRIENKSCKILQQKEVFSKSCALIYKMLGCNNPPPFVIPGLMLHLVIPLFGSSVSGFIDQSRTQTMFKFETAFNSFYLLTKQLDLAISCDIQITFEKHHENFEKFSSAHEDAGDYRLM